MNEYWGFVNGKLHVGDEDPKPAKIPVGNNLKDSHMRLLFDQMQERYRKKPTLENKSDYATALVYMGKYQQAKKLFLEIEHKKANLYNTAANLGTTYELLGQNDSALIWIQKAVAINPQSHFDSEWIHVKILEAKIKASLDTAFLSKNDILGLDFGRDTMPHNRSKIDLKTYTNQLYYQLTERMSFVQPNDPIVAQLTFDLATLYMLQNYHFEAYNTFDKAKKYGFEGALLEKWYNLSKKMSQTKGVLNFSEVTEQKPTQGKSVGKLLMTGLLAVFGLIAFMVWYRKRLNA
jgi:tetratricopeptide (TPR) repeat protein